MKFLPFPNGILHFVSFENIKINRGKGYNVEGEQEWLSGTWWVFVGFMLDLLDNPGENGPGLPLSNDHFIYRCEILLLLTLLLMVFYGPLVN